MRGRDNGRCDPDRTTAALTFQTEARRIAAGVWRDSGS